jgi:AraC-like DNA-binding protein
MRQPLLNATSERLLSHSGTPCVGVPSFWEKRRMPPPAMDRRLRVWSVIERNATDPRCGKVTINQLCRETGVSARMLYDVCRAFSGLSVTAYVRRERMTVALAMLIRGGPGHATVTQIATFCGFDQLGRFSRDFRDWHGESPSLVLRRSPETAAFDRGSVNVTT